MKCQICKVNDAELECIDCGRLICKDCSVLCELGEKKYCVQKLGDFIIFECKGIICTKCADFTLVHKCVECNISFCNAVLDKLIYECEKCLNKVCPDCKDKHIMKCKTIFDREKALNRLYESISKDGDNK
ncbi:MAG: hypothetical protein ACTSPY_03635 [Candidatus Helarchaeota archaeon]